MGESTHYHSGDAPLCDITYLVETVETGGGLITLGTITVIGEEVGREMDYYKSIVGHTHADIAKRKASKVWNGVPLILTVIEVK